MATDNAVNTVIDMVWSEDFWEVMESKVGLSRDKFFDLLSTNAEVQILMTTKQCDNLLKLQRQAEQSPDMAMIFQYLRPQFVNASRINYCSSCGTYHKDEPVFEVMDDNERAERKNTEVPPWNDGDDYGIFCSNCLKPYRIDHDAVYMHEGHRENNENIPYTCHDLDAHEVFALYLEHCHETYGLVTYAQQQLVASQLDFLSFMKKAEYDKLPT
jgi:hypothetical protein